MATFFNVEFDGDDYDFCMHGNLSAECQECDEIIEANGGIDKCMNCGQYMYGKQLNKNQVCKNPCRNPAEY